MTGFVAMTRSALDHPLLKYAERLRAWFWIVARACWKPAPFDVGGKMLTLERGQLSYSIRELAEQWGWSKSTADRFVKRLEAEGTPITARLNVIGPCPCQAGVKPF